MLCGLASLREKFMGQLRVADVSRKGAKTSASSVESARRRFPGVASWRWILHADRLPSVMSFASPAKEGGLRIWPQMDTRWTPRDVICEILWDSVAEDFHAADDCGLFRRQRDADGFPEVTRSQFLLFRHHSINPLSPSFAPAAIHPIKVNEGQ